VNSECNVYSNWLQQSHCSDANVITLGMVGNERSMSETPRRTSKGRKIGAWCICDAPKASPHLGCVFVQRRRKRRMARPKGPSRSDALAIVVLWRKDDRAARPVGGVWSKMPNSSPRRLAIWCFQGNQYVTLSSTVLFRAIAFQQTVLPPSRALILCVLARKSLKMTDNSKTGSRNMAETCAINFLILVSYSTSIVIGGLRRLLLAVLMWAGVDFEYFARNRRSAVFAFFPIFDHPLQKNYKTQRNNFRQFCRTLGVVLIFTANECCGENMYKWETLSTPPSRVELRSAVII